MSIKTITWIPLVRKRADPTTIADSWLIGQLLQEDPALMTKTQSSAPCTSKIDKTALSELQIKDKKPWTTLQPSRASKMSLHSTEFKHQIVPWYEIKMMSKLLITSWLTSGNPSLEHWHSRLILHKLSIFPLLMIRVRNTMSIWLVKSWKR